MLSKKAQFILICFLFVLTGVAALIYQVAWFKHLSYFMGNSTYAQAVVLATFMAGLAIGSWWWGKKADQVKNPLKLFAYLEIGIAVYCFFYQYIFEAIKHVFVNLVVHNHWASDSGIVLFFKVIASFIAIIIPTVLMGGTLPVLVKYLSDKIEEVGKNVAILYFINSLGAALGSLLAGFYLLNAFGINNTTYIATFLDLIVGFIFLGIAYKVPETKPKQSIPSTAEKIVFSINKNQYRIVVLIAGFSGLCAMMYEVAWVRLLVPILSSTTYSFTLMLSAFITGITLGSLLVYYLIPYLKKPFLFIGLCQAGIVVSILITLPFYEKLPYLIWKSVDLKNLTEASYQSYLQTQFYYIFMVMLIPTLFMGMTLPIATRMVVKKVEQSGSSVGNVFAVNTIGSVLGSLLSGMFFIPLIGIRHTIELGMLINLSFAALVIFYPQTLKRFYQYIFIGVIVISFGYYKLLVDDKSWVTSIMLSEIPRKINNKKKVPSSFQNFKKQAEEWHNELVYYKEGASGTFVVGKFSDEEYYLFTNGKSDANTIGDLRTQSSLGQTPLILHPKPDSVFVIGFGAGHTIGNVMTHSRVKFAQVAEISPEVMEASSFFTFANENPLADKRLQVIKDDGVTALRLSPYKYDVIISQPSNPWSAGVGNLFTKEFFADCKAKLRPGGYVAQWFSLYEMDDKSMQLIIRTAYSEFSNINLWKIGENDILLLCSNQTFNFNLDTIHKSYKQVSEKLSKKHVGIFSFSQFLAQQYITSNETLKLYTGEGPINTEDFPLLELWAPQAYFTHAVPIVFNRINEFQAYQENNFLLKEWTKTHPLNTTEKINIAYQNSESVSGKNVEFQKIYNTLNNTQKQNSSQIIPTYPGNLFFGHFDENGIFTALDKVHTDQKLYAWTCCGNVKENKTFIYEWISPSGKVYNQTHKYESSWVTSWLPFDKTPKLEVGKWKLNIKENDLVFLSNSFTVDPLAKKMEIDFPHNKIIVGVLTNNNKVKELKTIHPLENMVLSTSGYAYGKQETVNVVWTSPSGKKTIQAFTYLENYEYAWINNLVPKPLEQGIWTASIQNLNGKEYINKKFNVNSVAKLLDLNK